jgi:hypothetical protein
MPRHFASRLFIADWIQVGKLFKSLFLIQVNTHADDEIG